MKIQHGSAYPKSSKRINELSAYFIDSEKIGLMIRHSANYTDDIHIYFYS